MGKSGEAELHRANSFDQLRLFAALLVLAGHSYPLTMNIAPTFLGRSLHTLGLEIFFAISGYLVAESIARDPHPLRFLAKRALRIFPALWVATAILLIFGLTITNLRPIDYLQSTQTTSFLKNLVLDIQHALPGVLVDNPYGPAINGSWWSLPFEVMLYLLLLLCMFIGRRFGIFLIIAIYAALTVLQQSGVSNGRLNLFLTVGGFFVAGAALSALKRTAPPNALVALLLLLIAFLLRNEMQNWYMPALLAYCVVSFGLMADRMPIVARWLGDPSYGTYLYAFGAQQAVIAITPGIGPLLVTLLSAPIAVLLGVLSWRFVERPVLGLKPRRPVGRPQVVAAQPS
ncbi:MAG TPA: acyltransferase [Devosia sp.]|nr:acyltransferase [Devosia sp.]